MGADLIDLEESAIPVVPWLDGGTAALVRAIVAAVARRHADLRAAILYGSVARHEERPLDDFRPSDVDLLLVFNSDPHQLSLAQELAIFESIGLARDRYLNAPREVRVMLASAAMDEWDPTFVGNVARDGLLLWARGPLSKSLAPVAGRHPLRPASEQRAMMSGK